jgi:hypothetical protein
MTWSFRRQRQLRKFAGSLRKRNFQIRQQGGDFLWVKDSRLDH